MKILRFATALLWMLAAAVSHAKTLSAPAQVDADSVVKIALEGVATDRDFVTIVKPDAKPGAYGAYVYTGESTIELFAPVEPGDYEIRWLGAASPHPTLTSRALKVVAVSAQLQAPASAAIGTQIEIVWQGPNNPRDFITLVTAGTPEGRYDTYKYTDKGSPLQLQVPTAAGEYELRYLTGRGYKTLAAVPIRIDDSAASVKFTSPVRIGQPLRIQWSGPANPREFITVVPAGMTDGQYNAYTYVDQGNPLTLTVPDQPGDYEIRYMTADSKRVLARAPLQITAVESSVQAPATVVARQHFPVRWNGPGNEQDFVAVTEPGKPKSWLSYGYTKRGNPVEVEAPKKPGRYEIHYLTAQSHQSLAMQPIEVTPSATPGKLLVQASASGAAGQPAYAAVEVVLDASGSMLQKLDGKRRIDIARDTLRQLVDSMQGGNAQFALRVFGHRKADACDTELLLPPSALQAATVKQTIGKLEAKNLARTPIADSLAQVKTDLASVKGKALVILLTDGEETCDGDPAAAITALRKSGLDVRVNIVGFAIDEHALKQQFVAWAAAGGGAYFDAQNGKALAEALQQSLRQPFTVLDEKGATVASGAAGDAALELPAGNYRLQSGSHEQAATIAAGETLTVTLP